MKYINFFNFFLSSFDPSGQKRWKMKHFSYLSIISSVCMMLAFLLLGCAKDETTELTKPASASEQSDSLPPASEQTQQPKFQKAPPFTLQDVLDPNRKVSLQEFEGKVTFINIWATWCVPCRKEMPEIVSLYNKYRNRGFEVMALSVDDVDTQKDIKPYADEFKMNFTILLGNVDVVKSYKLAGLPSTYILDRQHNIRFAHTGIQPLEVFEAEVVKLLNE